MESNFIKLLTIFTILLIMLVGALTSVTIIYINTKTNDIQNREDQIYNLLCTHGASSTSSTIKNGKVVNGPTATTGCTGR